MNLEQFPNSPTARKMLGYISLGFYDQSYVGKWLFEVMGIELDNAKEKLSELPLQAFPETATWGLRYHEEKYGLPVRGDLSEEERRKLIFQRRDQKAPVTPFAMEEMLKNVTDFEVFVSDSHDIAAYVPKPGHPNRFDVVLVGEGTAAVGKIRELLDRVKQSHTDYQMRYYEHAEYEIPIRYENAVRFQTGFYPRYNLEFLHLDRTWKLDNARNLNGYNAAEQVDFYPVSIQIHIEAAREVQAETTGIMVVAAAENRPQAGNRFRTRNEIEETLQAEARAGIRTAAGYDANTASYMTKMNQLDNEWSLSGSRKLDGGRYIL